MPKKYEYVRRTVTWEGKQYTVRGKTEAEAAEKLGELKAALKRGDVGIGESSTVDRWFAEWKKLYKDSAGLTAKSLKMYDEKYSNYIKPAIGKMRLRDVRDVHLQKILNAQAGTSFSHVSKLRLVIKEMFSKARKSRIIPFDPSEDLTLPDNVHRSRRALTAEERKHLLKVAETHRAGLWVLIMLYAGLRPGELAALQWLDVDFPRNEIHVYKAIESGSRRVKDTKTEAGVRDIPIHQELLKVLLKQQGDPLAPVCPTEAGNYQNADSIYRIWRSFRRAIDINMGAKLYRNQIVESKLAEDLTMYCLRHTFCTDLEAAGVPINVAKVLMGHSDIAVTANIYTHKQQPLLHREISRLDGSATNSMTNSEAAPPIPCPATTIATD